MSKHYVYVTGTGYEFSKGEPSPDPREDFDHLGTMWCVSNHRNKLGDKQFSGDEWDLKAKLIEEYDPGIYDRLAFKFGDYYTDKDSRNEQDRMRKTYIDRLFDRYWLARDLFVYDHSGLAMSVFSFRNAVHGAWDSYWAGLIVVAKEKAKKEYGWKNITKSREAKLLEYLKNEVDEYSQYLSGEIYGFRLLEVPDEIIEEYSDDPDYDLQENAEYINLSECEEVEPMYGFYSKEECEAQAKDCLQGWEESHYARVAREAGQLDLPLAA